MAELHPVLVAKLGKAYDEFVAEFQKNKRSMAKMVRPEGALSAERPPRIKPKAKKRK